MDAVVEHLKEYYLFYVIASVGLLPVLYVTRKWSGPFLLYVVETALYLSLMHVAVYVLVLVTAWFKETSSMKALQKDGRPLDAPDWGTPILEFWDKAAYQPGWLVWVEVVFAAIIVFLVWRYRPMRIKYRRKKRHFVNEGNQKQRYGQSRVAQLASSQSAKGRRGRR